MGILARLDPRHWGGRRVLQFLTGLALAALALVATVDVPAASAGPARPVVVVAASTVETTPAGLDVGSADSDGAHAGEAEAQQAATGHAAPVAAAVPAAPDVVLQLTAVTGSVATPPTGSTPASLGSRAPPLR